MQAAITAHATHPDARMALALAAAQADAQRAARPGGFTPTLGLLYLSDRYAAQAEALLDDARGRWPGVHWAGGVGVGVMASGVEYFDEPALVLMLLDLPAAQFSLFNGRQPLDAARADTALVHADPATPELEELITELAERTGAGYLFGGLAASRSRNLHIADGVFEGGLSGVAFAAGVPLLSRVTQGCQPAGPTRRVTAAERNLVLALDGQPALPLLLADLGVDLEHPQQAMAALRATLAGLSDADDAMLSRGGQFGADTRVRHLIGIDPARQGVAIADVVQPGQQLAFCRRDVAAARRDLVRICAEIRDELEADAPVPALPGAAPATPQGEAPGRRIAAAVYVSCSGRGGPHFGGPSAEAQIVQHALGDVPLVGFFAGGEIARHHVYGYTGVLTVFTAD
ncbi:FIST N-terminal domain-containing protein [Ideonella sp. DXS22W]|uniref:FIST N-terminal domain-containing protein n=1 Tax=Pseudaquabacterium inlustre TaxID=2984192 RepID=A0ABU9CN00_9BURK